MANTFCPTCSSRLAPSAMALSLSAGASMRSTARSRSGKEPTWRAAYSPWSAISTRALVAPWMTWKFVTTWPNSSHRKPEPVPAGTSTTRVENRSRCAAVVVMCTTEGETRLKSCTWAASSASSGPRGVTARGCADGGPPRPST
jgi:hypothetical protein